MSASRALALMFVAGLAAASSSVALAQPAMADESLPPCAASDYIFGVATKTWDNGDFKISLFPTYKARGNPEQFVDYRSVANDVWHLTQACIPGLYGDLADSIYAQIACHVQGGWVTDEEGYKTGATWDLESWHPVSQVRVTTACGSTASSHGNVDEGSHTEHGVWNVVFGPVPPDMLEESTITIAEPPAAFAMDVVVSFTGGQGLWTRTGPGGPAGKVEVLPEGTHLTLLCQASGQTIYGPTTSALWDYVRLSDGRQYYVSDVYVDTGSNSQVAPSC